MSKRKDDFRKDDLRAVESEQAPRTSGFQWCHNDTRVTTKDFPNMTRRGKLEHLEAMRHSMAHLRVKIGALQAATSEIAHGCGREDRFERMGFHFQELERSAGAVLELLAQLRSVEQEFAIIRTLAELDGINTAD